MTATVIEAAKMAGELERLILEHVQAFEKASGTTLGDEIYVTHAETIGRAPEAVRVQVFPHLRRR